MEDVSVQSPLVFEEALARGATVGYAVCAKARRFERLPDSVAMTFAEVGDENCFYVFECKTDAERRMEGIAANERLGWLFSIREVSFLAEPSTTDGPRLDPIGQPFAMRGFVVDQAGATTEWTRGGRLGWRGGVSSPTGISPPADLSFLQRLFAFFRTSKFE